MVNYRYEILEKCGDGNFFSVYKARDKVLNRLVAVKVLFPEYASNPEFSKEFISSLQKASELNHPNIAKVLDADEYHSPNYIATEYVHGISLKERIKRTGPLSPAFAVEIAIAVAQALAYAHKHSIVHGDIKPDNIITGHEGIVKLTDFGVVDALEQFPDMRESAILNSVHYASPEVLRGEQAIPASDVYSLGVVLYEMLTGTVPFNGQTSSAVIAKHLQDPVPSPRMMNSAVPATLNDIVVKAMQKDPAYRFRNAAELLEALAKVQEWMRTGTITTSKPVQKTYETDESYEPTERGENFVRNTVIALLAILLVAIITAVIMYRFSGPGVNSLTVPNLIGKTLEEAQKIADQTGLKLEEYRHDYNDDYPEGTIWLTSPMPGRTVSRSNPVVRVWISKGPRLRTVPDVTGLSVDEARKKLMEAGLTLAPSPLTEYSTTVPMDKIIRQIPEAGTKLEPLKSVSVVVSMGPPPQDETTTGEQPYDNNTQPGDETAPVSRTFKVNFTIPPNASGPQDVRIEVSDESGDSVVYEGIHNPGESVSKEIAGYGEKVQIRVYINDKLARDIVYSGSKITRNKSYF